MASSLPLTHQLTGWGWAALHFSISSTGAHFASNDWLPVTTIWVIWIQPQAFLSTHCLQIKAGSTAEGMSSSHWLFGLFKKMPGESGEIGQREPIFPILICVLTPAQGLALCLALGGRQPHHQVRHSSLFSWGTHSLMGRKQQQKIITIQFSKAHKRWKGGSKWQPNLSEKLSQRVTWNFRYLRDE